MAPPFLQIFKHNETCENGLLPLGSRSADISDLIFTDPKKKICWAQLTNFPYVGQLFIVPFVHHIAFHDDFIYINVSILPCR